MEVTYSLFLQPENRTVCSECQNECGGNLINFTHVEKKVHFENSWQKYIRGEIGVEDICNFSSTMLALCYNCSHTKEGEIDSRYQPATVNLTFKERNLEIEASPLLYSTSVKKLD
jgi:hypothetical protein